MENQTADSQPSPCRASKVHWGVIFIAIAAVFALIYIILAVVFAGVAGLAFSLLIGLMVLPFAFLGAFINGAMLAGVYNVAFCADNDTMDKVAAGAGVLYWVVFPILGRVTKK